MIEKHTNKFKGDLCYENSSNIRNRKDFLAFWKDISVQDL